MTTTKTTPAQAKLLARLPEFFQIVEDYSKSSCPASEIRTEDGRDRNGDRFGRGESRAFHSLIEKGLIVHLGKVETGVKDRYAHAYGKA